MLSRRNMLRLSAIAFIVIALALAAGLTFTSLTQSHAQQTLVNAKDFVTPGSFPWGLAVDQKGKIWVALPGCNPAPTCPANTSPGKIGVFDPATSSWAASYQLPATYGQPLFLAFDKKGNLWFTMPVTNALGIFNPMKKSFSQWTVPTANSGPWDLVLQNQSNGQQYVWFTEHYGNKIGRFTPGTHQFQEVATPAADSQPYGITVDAMNTLWLTENNPAVSQIAEYKGGRVLEYKIRPQPSQFVTPHLIAAAANGDIWWTEGFASRLGRLQPNKAQPGTNNGVTEYAYDSGCNCGAHTSGIALDKNGTIWFDDSAASVIGSFSLSSNVFSFYKAPSPGSHTHDGLVLDRQNDLWVSEEFGNKLAEFTFTTNGSTAPAMKTPSQPKLTISKDATPVQAVPTATAPQPPVSTSSASDTMNNAHNVPFP